jgi:diguanylate cyclase (GGDEF)-like protein/PAS domain S-box-containing protein
MRSATDLPQLAQALTEPDAFREMLDGLADGVYLVDRRRKIVFWNKASERITGYSAEEVTGRHCFDNLMRHVNAEGERLCFGLCPLAHTMHDGKPRSDGVWLHHKDGHRVPVHVRTAPIRGTDHDRVIGAIEFFTDESGLEATEERVSELEELALTDPLTGLKDRRFLEVSIGGRLAQARVQRRGLAAVFADVDHFKAVNDTHGHEVGDRVLRMVANTLAHNLRGGDEIARFGGEEFVLLLSDVKPEALQSVCERLGILVRTSSIDMDGGGELAVTISMGATMAIREDSAERLLRRADTLLYQSKMDGRDRVTCA